MRRTNRAGRTKRYENILLLFVVIAVTFALFFGFLLLLEVRETPNEPVYESVSMSEEAAARAYVWLSQIEDMPFSYTEIRKMMGDIQLQLVLTPAGEKGKYVRTLADGTFADCQEKARAGLEKAYRGVVRYRILASGYEGELLDDRLDDLMREAYGVSVSEYLSYCNVQLTPTLEELTEMYSGEVADE